MHVRALPGQVSPEFMLRPSLSERLLVLGTLRVGVSPEFMLRPSLSARLRDERSAAGWCGVSPEFMLRPSLSGCAESV